MVARELSSNMKGTLMFHMVSIQQLKQTMVTRVLSLNMETMVARELSHCGGKDLHGAEERGQEEKEATHVHSAAQSDNSNIL